MSNYIKINNNERFIIDMLYAKIENMVGVDVYNEIGWGNVAVVHVDLWNRLKKIIPILEQEKLKLKIFDAYRPAYAHDTMVGIFPIKGLYASSSEKSLHCHGIAIDVCLCDENGEELLYPTKVDAYDKEYLLQVQNGCYEHYEENLRKAGHSSTAEGEEKDNRHFLKELMNQIGLDYLESEWWHYSLPYNDLSQYPVVDLNIEDF